MLVHTLSTPELIIRHCGLIPVVAALLLAPPVPVAAVVTEPGVSLQSWWLVWRRCAALVARPVTGDGPGRTVGALRRLHAAPAPLV